MQWPPSQVVQNFEQNILKFFYVEREREEVALDNVMFSSVAV